MFGDESGYPLYNRLPRIRVIGDIVKRAGTGLGPRVLGDYEPLLFPDGTRSLYVLEGEAFPLGESSFIVTRPAKALRIRIG